MDDEFDDVFDDDWPDEDDDEDESLVVTCPNCGTQVYEDAEQCPSCGEYIVHGSSVWSEKPLWWVLLALAGVVAVILVLSGLVW